MLSTKVARGDARGERRRSGNETHGPSSQHPVTCPLCHAIPGANLAFPLTLSPPGCVSFLLASLSLLTSFPLKQSWKCLQEGRVRSARSAWLATVWKEMLSPRSRPGTVLCRELADAFAFPFSPAFVERKASSFGNKGLFAQDFGYTSTCTDQNIPDTNSLGVIVILASSCHFFPSAGLRNKEISCNEWKFLSCVNSFLALAYQFSCILFEHLAT